ncbi:CgeB family protein [Salinithrix halophila]|uniref:Glycosyltransferase n=1 Tax=Salinithrix halophila TaxID=1485204 RepID=A0ABV8JI72_9BACL
MDVRLLYITSGIHSLAHLDPNLISGFTELEKKEEHFHFLTFHPGKESITTLFSKIYSFRPDVIISLRGALPRQVVDQVRQTGIPIGLYIVDDPYSFSEHSVMMQPYSFMITQDFACLPYYRRQNKRCFYLPLAVNQQLYHPLRVNQRYKSDICFIASATPIRRQYIDQMAEFLLQKRFLLIGRWWDRLKHYEKLKHGIMNRTISPVEVARYYNGAKIVLNIHRSKNDVRRNPLEIPAFTPNNRTFDIAACRSFQLVTHRRDLGRFYRLGEEIVSIRGADEMRQKIAYYLNHQRERKGIATRAYRRTVREHTYLERLRRFVRIVGVRLLGRYP